MRAAAVALLLTACAYPPAAPEGRSESAPLPLRLTGTEPFWGGVITSSEIVVSGADRATLRMPVDVTAGPDGRPGWGFSGLAENGAPLSIRIVPAACSDGMSDRVYPYKASVLIGRETLSGCAGPESLFVPAP